MELQKNPQHIVWLDVVRFVAMFTVVCCHCTDPFNFYPGTAPNIGEIKLWGAIYGALLRPCVPPVRDDYRSTASSGARRDLCLL